MDSGTQKYKTEEAELEDESGREMRQGDPVYLRRCGDGRTEGVPKDCAAAEYSGPVRF